MCRLHLSGLSVVAALAFAQDVVMPRANSSPSSTVSVAASTTAPSTASSSAGSLPPISASTSPTSSATSSYDGIASAPTVEGNGATYSYPPPTIPPTANAPYLQTSSLPSGTVFICVGAAIGFFFLVVIFWRLFAVWSLHKRMNRANAQYVGLPTGPPPSSSNDRKSGVLRKSGVKFYQNGTGSSYSLDPLTKSERRESAMPKTSQRQSNLFFSPTAGAGAHGTAQQRASSYLPAGYYAAGSAIGSTVVNAASTSDLSMRTGDRPITMVDFAPPHRLSYGYKDSPVVRPQSGHGLEPPNLPYAGNIAAQTSVSSLGMPSEGRAPSAYLEDLFDSTPVKERQSNERDQWR